MSRHSHPFAWLLLLSFGSIASGATVVFEPLAPLAPVPSLTRFAQNRGLPLEGIHTSGDQQSPRKGDQVTMLLALVTGDSEQQWIAILTADDLNARERELKPPPDVVVHTSTGLKLTFSNSRTALNVYLTGPFTARDSGSRDVPNVVETHARTIVSPEYLSAGLEPFARSALTVGDRMRAVGGTYFPYAAGPKPFTEDQINAGRYLVTKYGVTPEEERFENAAYFAMTTFFESARNVSGFDDIAKPIMAAPSFFSIVRRFGLSTSYVFRWIDVTKVDEGKVSLAQPTYEFPLKVMFNGKPATRAKLVVTQPRPPLQVCGGIVAICAEHPSDPSRRLFIRLIASRSGE